MCCGFTTTANSHANIFLCKNVCLNNTHFGPQAFYVQLNAKGGIWYELFYRRGLILIELHRKMFVNIIRTNMFNTIVLFLWFDDTNKIAVLWACNKLYKCVKCGECVKCLSYNFQANAWKLKENRYDLFLIEVLQHFCRFSLFICEY